MFRVDDYETFWALFVYASTDVQIRRKQWDYLVQERPKWGVCGVFFCGGLGGDFNDIKDNEEKSG